LNRAARIRSPGKGSLTAQSRTRASPSRVIWQTVVWQISGAVGQLRIRSQIRPRFERIASPVLTPACSGCVPGADRAAGSCAPLPSRS
jgi:hypothetical protein